MIGDGAKKLVERALAAAGLDPFEPEALDRYREIYERRLLDTTRPYDGMVEVLAAAKQRSPSALLSNKPEAPTRRLLDAFDLAGSFLLGHRRRLRLRTQARSGQPRVPDEQGGATAANDTLRRRLGD